MVIACKTGKILEKSAVMWIFDMGLERDHAFGFRQLEDRIHKGEKIFIGFFVIGHTFHEFTHVAQCSKNNPFLVTLQESACTGTQNNHKFQRLPEDRKASVRRISTGHTPKCNDDA